jgi:hypothetical protein
MPRVRSDLAQRRSRRAFLEDEATAVAVEEPREPAGKLSDGADLAHQCRQRHIAGPEADQVDGIVVERVGLLGGGAAAERQAELLGDRVDRRFHEDDASS